MSGKLNLSNEEGAAIRGQQVIHPAPNELFLDIDSYEALSFMNEQLLGTLGDDTTLNLEVVSRMPSRSGEGHWHVVLRSRTRTFTPAERIALQACLGSDLKRELYSLVRHLKGEEGTTFYENHDWKDPR